jgi:uncharacterized membrane protein
LQRKQSLAPSGAAAAFVVGLLAIGCSYAYGAILLAFYFYGSRLTAYGATIKQRFDFEHKKGEGERTWQQVLHF